MRNGDLGMQIKRIFLASSFELKDDRNAFEVAINRKNKEWVRRGVFLELVMWEDFLDAMSRTRLQDEYNRAVRECDLFVMLFWTKVGKYTAEEFETAFKQFQATKKPFVFTYFKTTAPTRSPSAADQKSLKAFQDKLKALGHFKTDYPNTEGLLLHFYGQLDKLVDNGFVEFRPGPSDEPATGAAAVRIGNVKVGERGVLVVGDNKGNINTGTQLDFGQKPRRKTH